MPIKAKRSIFRRIGRGFGVGSLTCAAGIGALAAYDEGTRRAIIFWGQIAPIFMHYKYVEWKTWNKTPEEQTAAFNRLHDKHAPKASVIVLRLKGWFVKLAQLASTRDDFVPKAYMEFFKTCQDQAEPLYTGDQVQARIEEILERPFHDVFESVDPTCLGAATIGQAHKAVLRTGETVAVKLQYPTAERYFRSDLGLCINFCKLALPQHVRPLEEFRRTFDVEFDYRKEGAEMDKIRENLQHSKWAKKYRVPRSYPEVTTKDMLVMSYFDGQPLIQAIKSNFAALAQQEGVTVDQFLEKRKREAPPPEWKIRMYENLGFVYDLLVNCLVALHNHSVGIISPSKKLGYHHTETPLHLRTMIEELLEIHAYQIFHDGLFNADPHPGNVMMLKDGSLGLLDYGQCGRMDEPNLTKFAKVVIALADERPEQEVGELLYQCGYRTKRNNRIIMAKLGEFYFNRDTKAAAEMNLNPLQYLDWMDREDPLKEIPRQFVLPGRMVLVLRAFSHAFNLDISYAQVFKPHAVSFLKSKGVDV